MTSETKIKLKKILINTAFVFAIIGSIWAIGRIFIHDIPTMIRGYDYVAIETEHRDDAFGRPREDVTEEVKRDVPFSESFGDFFNNVMLATISAGFFLAQSQYDPEYEE
jgi:hypothetical protein